MKNDIKDKLREQLSPPMAPIASEQQVVYILVEIRKLLELAERQRKKEGKPKDHTYSVLAFYCDWAVHPVMDWENGRQVVRLFDKYQGLLEAIRAAPTGTQLPEGSMDFLTEFNERVKLSAFRQQLASFLQSETIDSPITEDAHWTTFLSHYSRVIEDCPMRCVNEPMVYTDEVTLKVVDIVPPSAGGWALVIQWSWTSKVTGNESVNQQFFY